MNIKQKKALYESIMKSVAKTINEQISNTDISDNVSIFGETSVYDLIQNTEYSIPNFPNIKRLSALYKRIAPVCIEDTILVLLQKIFQESNMSKYNSHINYCSANHAVEIKSFLNYRSINSGYQKNTGCKITKTQLNEIIRNNASTLIVKYYLDNNKIYVDGYIVIPASLISKCVFNDFVCLDDLTDDDLNECVNYLI